MTKYRNSNMKKGFTQIANDGAFDDTRLMGLPIAILWQALKQQNRKKEPMLHREYFAKALGTTEKSIKRAMKVLVACGYALKGNDKRGDFANYTFSQYPIFKNAEGDKNDPFEGDKNVHVKAVKGDKNVPLYNKYIIKGDTPISNSSSTEDLDIDPLFSEEREEEILPPNNEKREEQICAPQDKVERQICHSKGDKSVTLNEKEQQLYEKLETTPSAEHDKSMGKFDALRVTQFVRDIMIS